MICTRGKIVLRGGDVGERGIRGSLQIFINIHCDFELDDEVSVTHVPPELFCS